MGSGRPDQFNDYFGMAGHLAVMSEFLLRGYNVALPFVDRGDDVITLEDPKDEIRRVQVKTSKLYDCSGAQNRRPKCGDECRICKREILRLIFSLKGTQLRAPDKNTQLFYVLMFRHDDRWRFFLIPRSALHDVRKKFEMNRPRESVKDLTLEIQGVRLLLGNAKSNDSARFRARFLEKRASSGYAWVAKPRHTSPDEKGPTRWKHGSLPRTTPVLS